MLKQATNIFKSTPFALCFITLVCAVLYAPFMSAPAHLDDQFLVSWLNRLQAYDAGEFFAWGGPDKLDAWGPVIHYWYLAKNTFIGSSLVLWRLTGLTTHVLTAILIYFSVRLLPLQNSKLLALPCALLFAAYPLHPEAVFWISGRASELSACFLIFAIYSLLRFKHAETSRRLPWLIATVALVALSLGTQLPLWISNHVLSISDWSHLLRNLLFPINNEICPKYTREYRFLYFLSVPVLIGAGIAIWKNKSYRLELAAVFLICLVACLPYVGIATTERNLYGSRWLYFASFPVCLFLTLLYSGFMQASKKAKLLGGGLGLIAVTLLFIFFCRMTAQQNTAYKQQTHLLGDIQKSAAIMVAKEKSPFVIIRDLPRSSAIVPSPSLYSAVALDGQTGLLSAWVVPSERLKKALHAGKLQESSARWDKDFLSLVPFDLTPTESNYQEMDAGLFALKMMPGIIFYRTAHFDDKEKLIVLETNSVKSGPAVRVSGEGTSPCGSQFFYVDAKINTADIRPGQEVELYWTTRLYDDYHHDDRRAFTNAIVNDGQFHRYYLPLTGIGFFANGTVHTFTLGFPAGSKVWLKGAGIANGDNLVAQLEIADSYDPSAPAANKSPYFSPYFQYPQSKELGLASIVGNATQLPLTYSTKNIDGAQGAILEISNCNQFFSNPNGNVLSATDFKQIRLDKKEGSINFKASEVEQKGVYSLRILAIDEKGNPIGNASDSINCLVR